MWYKLCETTHFADAANEINSNPPSEEKIKEVIFKNTNAYNGSSDHPIKIDGCWRMPKPELNSHKMLNEAIHNSLGLNEPKQVLFDFMVDSLPGSSEIVRCSCYENESIYGNNKIIRECAVDIKGTPTLDLMTEIKMITRARINAWSIIDNNNQKHEGFGETSLIQEIDRKSTRLNSSHVSESRMPSSA